MYYWDCLDTLKQFPVHTTHPKAKRQYAKWYRGYHTVVAEVLRSCGDGAFPHITPNCRTRAG